MTEFTINRKNWATGSNGYHLNNHLLNRDGKMCCLGFYCNRVARIPKEDIMLVPTIMRLARKYFKKPSIKKLIEFDKNSDEIRDNLLCENLTTYNDWVYGTTSQKESEIKMLFKKIGYNVKFVGKYEDE